MSTFFNSTPQNTIKIYHHVTNNHDKKYVKKLIVLQYLNSSFLPNKTKNKNWLNIMNKICNLLFCFFIGSDIFFYKITKYRIQQIKKTY